MNKFWDLIKQTYKKKSINRILMNWKIYEHCKGLRGVMIDLGSGQNPSYQRYWQIEPSKFLRVDIDREHAPDITADLNKPLPFEDNFADVIFLFSVIYIVKKPDELIKEIFRVLKPEGKFFLFSPFVFNESREPDDYLRFTSQGIERLLNESGFKKYQLMKVGGRFTSSLYLAEPIIIFWPLKILCRAFALLLDKLYPKKLKKLHPCPLRYFAIAQK